MNRINVRTYTCSQCGASFETEAEIDPEMLARAVQLPVSELEALHHRFMERANICESAREIMIFQKNYEEAYVCDFRRKGWMAAAQMVKEQIASSDTPQRVSSGGS